MTARAAADAARAPVGPDWPGPPGAYDAVPGRASGTGADRTLWLLDRAIGAYLWWTTGVPRRRRPAAAPVPDTRVLTVTDTALIARDTPVLAVTLADPGGAPLAPWTPGAHVELTLPSGLRRHYSLWSDPAATDHYRIAIRLVPGGAGSAELHRFLRPGATVEVSTPRNAFAFLPESAAGAPAHIRLIAGGIGITAILPMARAAAAAGLDWSLILTGRSAAATPLRDQVRALGPRAAVRLDDGAGPPAAAELLGPALSGGRDGHTAAVYCCGPAPMLAAVHAAVGTRTDIALHTERFAPPVATDGHPFTLQAARSGRSATVAADRTTLDTALDLDPAMPYSCRQGFCRTCTVRVLSGEVDHRDRVLSDDERARGMMLPCVSRAAGNHLIIDR